MTSKSNKVKKTLQAAMAHHKAGNFEQAESVYKQVLQLDRGNAEAYQLLGLIAYKQKKHDIAVQLISKAIELKHGRASSYYNLGNAFLALEKIGAAEDSFRQSLKINPDLAEAHNKLGKILLQQDKPAAAEESFRQALRIRPDYIGALNNLGNALEGQGKITDAEELYKQVLDRQPDLAIVYHNIAYLNNQVLNRPYYFKGHKYLKKVQQLLKEANNTKEGTLHLHFALGEMYDNCKMYDEAFKHFQQANKIKHKDMNFVFSDVTDQIEEIINSFTSDSFSQKHIKGSSTSRPVFIIGLPRSGKTMVEGMLANHPQFWGGGEKIEIDRLINEELPKQLGKKVKYPAVMKFIDSQIIADIADQYENYLIRLAGRPVQKISNTFPYNYKLLGIIALMFPNTRIIYCRRNPLDLCLAIYFKDFMVGQTYAYDLDEIAFFYRQTEKLMAHWKQVLPLNIYDMQFEEFLGNPEGEIAKLADFLGLESDPQLLGQFNNTLSPGSSAESIPPLDTKHPRGIGWSENYRKLLGPLKESLKNT